MRFPVLKGGRRKGTRGLAKQKERRGVVSPDRERRAVEWTFSAGTKGKSCPFFLFAKGESNPFLMWKGGTLGDSP